MLASLLSAVQRGSRFGSCTTSTPGPHPRPTAARDDAGRDRVATRPDARCRRVPDLMHHKFVVRDGETSGRARRTGPTTPGRGRRTSSSRSLAGDRLRLSLPSTSSGRAAGSALRRRPAPRDRDGHRVRAWFCPEYGEPLSHRVAKHIGNAKARVRIASPVLTSGPILATLVEVVNERRCDVTGIVDDTQVDQVFHQWKTNGVSEWKVPLLRRIIEGAEFHGKDSIPWTPESVHNFMHAKLVVADDTAFVGSFNFSARASRTPRTCSRSRTRPSRGTSARTSTIYGGLSACNASRLIGELRLSRRDDDRGRRALAPARGTRPRCCSRPDRGRTPRSSRGGTCARQAPRCPSAGSDGGGVEPPDCLLVLGGEREMKVLGGWAVGAHEGLVGPEGAFSPLHLDPERPERGLVEAATRFQVADPQVHVVEEPAAVELHPPTMPAGAVRTECLPPRHRSLKESQRRAG